MCIKNPRIRSCAILQWLRWVLVFLVAKFFGSLLKKKSFCVFFLKSQQKNLSTEKLKLPSESLDNFAFCHVAVFKLYKVSLFLLLIENIGSYDSLLLHCAPSPQWPIHLFQIINILIEDFFMHPRLSPPFLSIVSYFKLNPSSRNSDF